MQYYGIDLLDLGTPRLSFRRLASLLSQLPRDSRYVNDTVGERARWSATDHLLADVVDQLNWLIWVNVAVNSKRPPKKPTPIKRPGVEQQGQKRFGTARMTLKQARAYLDRFKVKGGGNGS